MIRRQKNAYNLGKSAEKHAEKYLISHGFAIVAKNYRYQRAEIDIIAQKESLLLFIEVKARTRLDFGYPENFVSQQQSELIKKAAENYLFQHKWDGSIRFDIISILKQREKMKITYFEDAII